MTTAVITSLGMLVGLHSATSSKLAVIAGLVIMGIADGLSDAMSLHTVEEAELEKGESKHTPREVWLTTFLAFISVFGFTLTFIIPVLIFSPKIAIIIDIVWGILLLITLNSYIAKIKKENPLRLISEHILLAMVVIAVSYWVGSLISMRLE